MRDYDGVPAGVLQGRGEGNVADLQELWSRKENHVRGVVEERVHQASLVDDEDLEAGLLDFDGTGEARGPGADDHYVAARLWMCFGLGFGQSFHDRGSENVGHGP